jgi:threonine synthase
MTIASSTASQVRCIQCDAICDTASANFRCPSCGDLLEVTYPGVQTIFGSSAEVEKVKQLWLSRRSSWLPLDQSGVWRFREVLPYIDPAHVVTLREGNTPLYEMPRCRRIAGVKNLFAKHQGMNPTGSFKDTGMTTAASVAHAAGYRWVACASTGNTSASMAAYAARGNMRSVVLIPEGKISWSKLSQSLDYGAVTCQLKTDFDGCVRVLNEVVQRMPIYLLNSVNPYRLEGQKTAALEILEEFNWQVPDHVIVPGGNLANSSALGKAFLEMKSLGFVSKVPKVSIIQAAGANPLVRTMRENEGRELIGVQAETLATAIRIGHPASWKKAVRVLEATSGAVGDVSEAEMALAKAEIGAEGVGCEPASAVTLAGLKKLVASGFVKSNETVVLVLTGHLLKDPDFTLKFHRGELLAGDKQAGMLASSRRAPIVLEPSADAVTRILKEIDSSAGM